jgi:NADPH:quinone reductase
MMRAVGYQRSLPIDDPAALEDIEVPDPVPGARDLLVEVRAVSVNPVDWKVRLRAEPESGHNVLGFDAAGVVRAVGAEVGLFRPGDEVYYAGDIGRPGTNAQLHLVDERIVGRKPASLGFADAAALPLTTITAWEVLFDCFDLREGGGEGDSLLVIGGAGGVGSIMIQLAKQLTALRVVATASRPETEAWCRKMGADAVIDHRRPMAPQLDALGRRPRYVASLTDTPAHFPAIVELVLPRGEIAFIDNLDDIDSGLIKPKSLSLHCEYMFTRPTLQTDDMIEQHRLLDRVSALVDERRIRTTANRDGGTLDAESLRRAHAFQESGRAIGKTVLTVQ